MPHPGPTETDIFRIRPSAVPYFFIIAGIAILAGLLAFFLFPIASVLSFIVVGVSLFAIGVVVLAFLTTQYALTTEKVHIRRGIITRFHEDIEVDRISGVELHQGAIGRILNYGDIIIDGDSPNSRIIFRQIAAPKFRHEQIEHETLG